MKKAATERCLFLGEGIFCFMGCNKKLYNVLGGVTSSIIPEPPPFVYTRKSRILQKLLHFLVHFDQAFAFSSFFRIYLYVFKE